MVDGESLTNTPVYGVYKGVVLVKSASDQTTHYKLNTVIMGTKKEREIYAMTITESLALRTHIMLTESVRLM